MLIFLGISTSQFTDDRLQRRCRTEACDAQQIRLLPRIAPGPAADRRRPAGFQAHAVALSKGCQGPTATIMEFTATMPGTATVLASDQGNLFNETSACGPPARRRDIGGSLRQIRGGRADSYGRF